jgi:hypothetical protein
LDVAKLARELNPSRFHVTSQPMPAVISGATYEYQVTVNNPELVTRYTLGSPVTGATLSPTGALRYTTPNNTSAPTQLEFDIQIEGKDATRVQHRFPLNIVPRNLPAPPKTPGIPI